MIEGIGTSKPKRSGADEPVRSVEEIRRSLSEGDAEQRIARARRAMRWCMPQLIASALLFAMASPPPSGTRTEEPPSVAGAAGLAIAMLVLWAWSEKKPLPALLLASALSLLTVADATHYPGISSLLGVVGRLAFLPFTLSGILAALSLRNLGASR